MWSAYGGVKRGLAYGATGFGFRAVQDRMHITTCTRPSWAWTTNSGRDFRRTDVHGRVVREILA